jgi:hypothetical protein
MGRLHVGHDGSLHPEGPGDQAIEGDRGIYSTVIIKGRLVCI